MVKVSVIGGRGRTHPPGTEVDTGMPITHPAVMIPIIGMIILLTIALVTCFCKLWPSLVPESCRLFGKRSADKNLELELGRRPRRKTSEASQVSGRSNRSHQNRSSRTPSFNSKDWAAGRPYLDQPPSYSPPPPPPSYGLSPTSMSTAFPPVAPYECSKGFHEQKQQNTNFSQV